MIFIKLLIYLALFVNYGHSLIDSNGVYVRKNAKHMTRKEWDSFIRGFDVLNRRSAEDPFNPIGHIYQYLIHGYPPIYSHPEFQDLFNIHQCQHGHHFFLPWHRMYQYYFEKILRDASGDPELTIPYWDYYDETQQIIPEVFRNPNNSLYYYRCHDMNTDGKLPKNIINHIPALFILNFSGELNQCSGISSFGSAKRQEPAFHPPNGTGAIEDLPHIAVHHYLGGVMGDECSTARDPIFWPHHAQIDRIWDSWVRLRGGQIPLRDTNLMEKEFRFFDINGRLISSKVKDFMDPLVQLNYRYEQFAEIPDKSVKIKKQFINPKVIQMAKYNNLNEQDFSTADNADIRLELNANGDRILRKISLNQIPGNCIQIFLQLQYSYTNTYKVIYDIHMNSPFGNYDPQSDNYLRPFLMFDGCDITRSEENARCYDITPNIFTLFGNCNFDNFSVNLTFVPIICKPNRVKELRELNGRIEFNEITLFAKIENENFKN